MKQLIIKLIRSFYKIFILPVITEDIAKNFYRIFLKFSIWLKEMNLNENDKCLCLVPHQDDDSIGMGGTLARYHKQFSVICLTDGSLGIKNIDKSEVIKIRNAEFATAMNEAQITNYYNLGAVDTHLIERYDLFKNIDFNKYNFIFIPNPLDIHKDHKAVSALLYKYLNEHPEYTPQIAFFEVWSALGYINTFVDVSNYIKIKEKMINSYISQCVQREYNTGCISLAKYRGMIANKEYAEAFFVMSTDEFKNIVKDVYKFSL